MINEYIKKEKRHKNCLLKHVLQKGKKNGGNNYAKIYVG